MKNLAETTLVLSKFERESLEIAFQERPSESPAGRVVEMIYDKASHLMPDTPFILALCELYHQRRLKVNPNE